MTTIESFGKTIVSSPMAITKTSPDAISPEFEPGFGEFLTISAVSRSEGRQEDIQNQWNRFETGIRVAVPPGFRLMLFDHPQLKTAGYSLLGPTPVFEDQGELQLDVFKLTEQDQLDLPFSIALCRLEKIYSFTAPEPKLAKAEPARRHAQKKSKDARKKRRSSSSEEDVPRRKGSTKMW